MTDRLFDPTPYGCGNEREPRKPKPARTIVVTGPGWGLLARHGKPPAPLVHRWGPDRVLWESGEGPVPVDGSEKRWEGAYKTVCGITGRLIPLEPGVEVVACPKCEKAS